MKRILHSPAVHLAAWAGALIAAHGCLILVARSHAGADIVETVNQQVNRQLTWRDIHNNYDWTPYTHSGDCKTYVALKRRLLLQAGVKRERLAIWQGVDENGHGHAVLVVDGARVLDNRFAWTESLATLTNLHGPRRGYRMSLCSSCERMAALLSGAPEDGAVTLPDRASGYVPQLAILRGRLALAPADPPATE